jgi:hypothetical protein
MNCEHLNVESRTVALRGSLRNSNSFTTEDAEEQRAEDTEEGVSLPCRPER